MLPHLPTINGDRDPAPVLVPAPPKFRAPLGEIRDVRIEETSPEDYAAQQGTSAAQRAGLAYESRIQRTLIRELGPLYRPAPSVYFSDDRGRRCCIPDGLVIRDMACVVIEIKSQHMPEAWWQLRKLYEPVLRKVYPVVALLEICKSYDPHMPFPETPLLLDGITKDRLGDGEFGVYPWKM